MAARLISVIGAPASGKTTLAEHLAAELPAGFLREDFQGNPFLKASYTGPPEARLPAQLHYLLSRINQLAKAHWPKEGLLVSDYGFCQDRLYACQRLGGDDLAVYDQVYARLAPLVHQPDLLIHLDGPEPVLLDRIIRRGRDFEQVMTRDFLSAMREAYNESIRSAPCPVLKVDCNRQDLREPAARARLIEEIRRRLLATIP